MEMKPSDQSSGSRQSSDLGAVLEADNETVDSWQETAQIDGD